MSATYELFTREEILATKLGVWEARLAFALASSDDENWIEECERAVRDLSAQVAKVTA